MFPWPPLGPRPVVVVVVEAVEAAALWRAIENWPTCLGPCRDHGIPVASVGVHYCSYWRDGNEFGVAYPPGTAVERAMPEAVVAPRRDADCGRDQGEVEVPEQRLRARRLCPTPFRVADVHRDWPRVPRPFRDLARPVVRVDWRWIATHKEMVFRSRWRGHECRSRHR